MLMWAFNIGGFQHPMLLDSLNLFSSKLVLSLFQFFVFLSYLQVWVICDYPLRYKWKDIFSFILGIRPWPHKKHEPNSAILTCIGAGRLTHAWATPSMCLRQLLPAAGQGETFPLPQVMWQKPQWVCWDLFQLKSAPGVFVFKTVLWQTYFKTAALGPLSHLGERWDLCIERYTFGRFVLW